MTKFNEAVATFERCSLDASNIKNFFGACYRKRLDAAFEHVKQAYDAACKADDQDREMSEQNAAAAPSDTPETDQLIKSLGDDQEPDMVVCSCGQCQAFTLCRQLERDRNRLREELKRAREANIIIRGAQKDDCERADKAESALTALQKRIDEAGSELPIYADTHSGGFFSEHKVTQADYDKLRAAASAIIARQKAEIDELRQELGNRRSKCQE